MRGGGVNGFGEGPCGAVVVEEWQGFDMMIAVVVAERWLVARCQLNYRRKIEETYDHALGRAVSLSIGRGKPWKESHRLSV